MSEKQEYTWFYVDGFYHYMDENNVIVAITNRPEGIEVSSLDALTSRK